jgi:hypothetical protein
VLSWRRNVRRERMGTVEHMSGTVGARVNVRTVGFNCHSAPSRRASVQSDYCSNASPSGPRPIRGPNTLLPARVHGGIGGLGTHRRGFVGRHSLPDDGPAGAWPVARPGRRRLFGGGGDRGCGRGSRCGGDLGLHPRRLLDGRAVWRCPSRSGSPTA